MWSEEDGIEMQLEQPRRSDDTASCCLVVMTIELKVDGVERDSISDGRFCALLPALSPLKTM